MKQAGIALTTLAFLVLVLAKPMGAQVAPQAATDTATHATSAADTQATGSDTPTPATAQAAGADGAAQPAPQASSNTAAQAAAQVPTDSAAMPAAQAAPAAPDAGVAAQIATLNARIAKLETDLGSAEKKAVALERGLAAEKDSRSAGERAAASLQSRLATASSTAEELRAKLKERDIIADRLALLATERDRLVVSLGAERSGILDPAGWPVTVLSGFAAAKPKLGTWKLGSAQAEQTNSKEFFSRLEIPLVQKNKSYLYRFSMQSTGKGWVGLGLHFFASDVRSGKGYGEGRSLLVWFTRDPAARKSDATWLQLYRSDNDVVMEK
ncbi:MAG: hypothetical protein WCQ50_06890, partial [Spirochaetota bacterium]